MYKVGIMLMGKPTTTPKKVKEIIIEVEAKTKISDILTYLIDLKRIEDTNVNVAIQKNGKAVSQASTITQILRHTKPVNNLIKLFLYDHEQSLDDMNSSAQKIVFQPTKQEEHIQMLKGDLKKQSQRMQNKKLRQGKKSSAKQPQQSEAQQQGKKSGCCCC